MDILNVFNVIVCSDLENTQFTTGWLFSLIFAPLNILIPNQKFAILAYFTILIFFILIYSSQSKIMSIFNSDKDGKKSWMNSLFSAFLLYMFQATIILLFLRFNICSKTLDWASQDYHVTLQKYSNENIEQRTGY